MKIYISNCERLLCLSQSESLFGRLKALHMQDENTPNDLFHTKYLKKYSTYAHSDFKLATTVITTFTDLRIQITRDCWFILWP